MEEKHEKVQVKNWNDFCPQQLFLYGTYREDGTPNFGLFCWFSYLNAPDMNGEGDGMGVMTCISGEKLTKDLIRKNGVFSANLVTEDLLPLADYYGIVGGREHKDKLRFSPTIEKGVVLDVPTIAESPVSMELKVFKEISFDNKCDTVLFLHSHFSRGLLAFSGQILPFSGHYRCLFPDFRGHGRSVCDDLTWNSRMIADDMALFLDKLGIEIAHLIGYSCGAYVGCYMASKYPDKVKSLVTIGGGAYARPEGASDMLPENLIKAGATEFIEDMKVRHYEAHKGDWQTFLRNTVADWQQHPNLTDDEWKKIVCPALFINGENDPFGTVEELQEKVPSSSVYKVMGGNHRPHFVGEQIDDVNTRIMDFLSHL